MEVLVWVPVSVLGGSGLFWRSLLVRWDGSGTTGTGWFGLVPVLVEVLVPGWISFSEMGVHFLPPFLLGYYLALFGYSQIRFPGPLAEVVHVCF